jgi:hypothetical protein
VPAGVVEKVRDQLLQARPVGEHPQVRRLHAHGVLDGAVRQPRLGDRLVQEGNEADRFPLQGRDAGVDPGQVQQVRDQAAQPFGLVERRTQRRVVRRRDPVDQVLHDRTQRGDGCAELVRDVGHQIAALPVDGVQVRRHRVERGGQLADLVAG